MHLLKSYIAILTFKYYENCIFGKIIFLPFINSHNFKQTLRI